MTVDKIHINLVTIGSAGSGKSTTMGHLMYESGNVGKSHIEKYQAAAKQGSHFAWILDTLEKERAAGQTIETSVWRMETDRTLFSVINIPGDPAYMDNAIPGITQGDCALLVVSAEPGDAEGGIPGMEEIKKQLLIARVMLVQQLIVAVNKMDATQPAYNQDRFVKVKTELSKYLPKISYRPKAVAWVPISGWLGENLKDLSAHMPWYTGWTMSRREGTATGKTLCDALNSLVVPNRQTDTPLRVPVSSVLNEGGTVVCGRIASGTLKECRKLTFAPDGPTGVVKSVKMHYHPVTYRGAPAGDYVNFKVDVPLDRIQRGMMVGDFYADPPEPAKEFNVQVRIMDHTDIKVGYTSTMYVHTTKGACSLEEIINKINPRTGAAVDEPVESLKTGDVAVVRIKPLEPMSLESGAEFPFISRLVLTENKRVVAVGCVKSVTKEECIF